MSELEMCLCHDYLFCYQSLDSNCHLMTGNFQELSSYFVMPFKIFRPSSNKVQYKTKRKDNYCVFLQKNHKL